MTAIEASNNGDDILLCTQATSVSIGSKIDYSPYALFRPQNLQAIYILLQRNLVAVSEAIALTIEHGN